jgi:hypothetical protein
MGDQPPTIDELRRQHKCVEQCGKEFTKADEAWRKAYDDKQITLEQTLAGMHEARQVHDDCCAECVPRRRQFSDKQKDEFASAFGGKILGIVTGVVVGGFLAGLEKTRFVGVFVLSVTAGSTGTFVGLGKIPPDPMDPQFSTVPVPSAPRLPAIRGARNTGLPGSVDRTGKAVLANQAKTIGLLNAIVTALNRSDGAAKAGNTSAEKRQLRAARDFAGSLAGLIKQAAPLRSALASELTAHNLDFAISKPDVVKTRDKIISNGFPSPFLTALKKLDVDRKERDAVLQRLFVQLVNLRPSRLRVRDLFIDPQSRAAETRVAGVFDRFSRGR